MSINVGDKIPEFKLINTNKDFLEDKDFLGKKTIEVNGRKYNTLHFNFSSTDKKLAKDKKLNTNIWYEEETLNWVKASFEKKGKWEYKLVSIE